MSSYITHDITFFSILIFLPAHNGTGKDSLHSFNTNDLISDIEESEDDMVLSLPIKIL